MRRMVKLLLLCLVLGGGVLVLFSALYQPEDKTNQALVGQPFPEFSLPELTAPEMMIDQRLFSEHNWTLVNVWASWCGICFAEHDYLTQLAGQDIAILGVNYRDDIFSAAQYLERNGNPYIRTLFDKETKLGYELGVVGTPETLLVDSKGVIRQRFLGELTPEVWQQKFMPLIEEMNQ